LEVVGAGTVGELGVTRPPPGEVELLPGGAFAVVVG